MPAGSSDDGEIMPFKTRYGTHYHENQGCPAIAGREVEPCSAAGLEPCSICCGGSSSGGGGTVGGAGATGAPSGDGAYAVGTDGAAIPQDMAQGEMPDVGNDPLGRGRAMAEAGSSGTREAGTPDMPAEGVASHIPSDAAERSARTATRDGRHAPICEIVSVPLENDWTGERRDVSVAVTNQGHYQLPEGLSGSEYGQMFFACSRHYLETVSPEQAESARLISFYNPDTNELSFGAISIDFAYRHTMENQGMSLQLTDASVPVDGYMIACDPEDDAERRKDAVPPASEFASPEEYAADFRRRMADFVERNADVLTRDGMHLGTWLDPETGICYFDISERIEDLEEAKRLGDRRNEISVWDVENMVEIPTGGDGTW